MADDRLLRVVLHGLASPQKSLPATLFYDEAGSALFDRITTVEDYYPTRVEAEIFREHAAEMAAAAADGATRVVMVEPGCGSGAKAAALLAHLPAVAYVGIDVSVTALTAGASRLEEAFPKVKVMAVEADYHAPFALPPLPEGRRIGFFPGSTIGNFDPDDAVHFLANVREIVGSGGRLLIGVDLWKDPEVLRRAYDDHEGITAGFNKNALVHLNRRYAADFELSQFDHHSRVDPVLRRVEMHLRARVAQSFQVAGRRFTMAAGETIHTENAYKYDVSGFRALAVRAGFQLRQAWTDAGSRFAVLLLAA